MSSKNSSLSPKNERTLPSSSSSESMAEVLVKSSNGTRSLAEMRVVSEACSVSSRHSSRLPSEFLAAGFDQTE